VSAEPGEAHWFEPIADHLGAAYLRYSFTKGTGQEVDFLVAALGLEPGMRVLDVGCGPGRHAHELARRGFTVHGVDISERFVGLASAAAPKGATFERLDARALPFTDDFDAAVSLCQGAFGLVIGEGEDEQVLAGIARAVRPGGRVAVSAFNAYFAVRHHTDAVFDADRGLDHEWTEVRDESGRAKEVELWTSCFTPRELRLLFRSAGLRVDALHSVEPGAYAAVPPTTESPEYLVLATKPS
jgi:SAM-dependent methyltransferase